MDAHVHRLVQEDEEEEEEERVPDRSVLFPPIIRVSANCGLFVSLLPNQNLQGTVHQNHVASVVSQEGKRGRAVHSHPRPVFKRAFITGVESESDMADVFEFVFRWGGL